MLNDDVIRRAERNFRLYSKNGMISKVERVDSRIVNVFLRNAQESIDIAEMSSSESVSSMWTIDNGRKTHKLGSAFSNSQKIG